MTTKSDDDSKENIKRLVSNIRRLASDAEFNLQNGRKKTSLFLYITATEEYVTKYSDSNQTKPKRQPNHREKLGVINNRFSEASKKMKEITPNLLDIFAKFAKEKVAHALSQKLSEDDMNRLKGMESRIKEAKGSAEVIEAVSKGFVDELTKDFQNAYDSIGDRFYSDKVRNRCLYYDADDTPLAEEEIDSSIKMYKKIVDDIIAHFDKAGESPPVPLEIFLKFVDSDEIPKTKHKK